MTEHSAERFTWAVETMRPAQSDRILEIGCGHGVAVSLICESWPVETITAIDRSKRMIDQAVRRNREHVDAGRATFRAVALRNADFGDERFDKAFAINVRLFRSDAAREADVLRHAITTEGTLYLFQQHPSASRTRAVTDELKAALEASEFAIRDVKSTGAGPSLMICIVARSRP